MSMFPFLACPPRSLWGMVSADAVNLKDLLYGEIVQFAFAESPGTRKKSALTTNAEMQPYFCSNEMVTCSDGSSTASENTNVFNRGMKLPADQCVVQHMPFLRVGVQASRLMNMFVLEEGIGDYEVMVDAEISDSLFILIQMLDNVRTNNTEAELVLLSTHSNVKIAHNEQRVISSYPIHLPLQITLERVGSDFGCYLTRLRVDRGVYGDESDVNRMSAQTAVHDSFAQRVSGRPSYSPCGCRLLV